MPAPLRAIVDASGEPFVDLLRRGVKDDVAIFARG